MTDRLLRALAEADAASAAGLGPEELADILWLAGCLDDAARDRDRPAPPVQPGGSADEAAPGAGPDDGPADERAPDEPPSEQHYATADLAAPPSAPHQAPAPEAEPDPGPGGPEPDGRAENAPAARRGDLVRVPRAAALADPLAVMRALRPLGRRTLADAHGEPELDEEATVSAGVDQRLLLPVLRPTPGRWLDLALVIDTHRSMTLWHDLVAELRRVIAQTGVFRDVRTWYLGGTEAGGRPGLAARPGGALRRPQEIADPAGRRLILVVTDTVGGGWGGPALDAVLRGWGRHGPVAVLNVLPERLWSRGSVRPTPLWLRAAGPAAPNTAWEAAATRARGRTHRRLRADAPDRPLPVPVVDPNPASLAALAALVSGGGRRSRLSCLLVGEPGTAPVDRADRPPASDGSGRPPTAGAHGRPTTAAEPALERFRASASPLAQELAGHLSAVPLVLPVMTLVRRAMLPQADHGHLAEVLLGGLLAPWEAPPPGADPDVVEFDFLPGVRDALLGAQRRDTVARIRRTVRHQVAAYLRSRRASAADFPAVRVAEETQSRELAPDALPFAESPAAVPAPTPALPPAYRSAEESWDSMTVAEALERPDLLGVRPAEQRPGLPYLTPYLDRPVDAEIRRLVGRAAQGVSTVLLVAGGPASGRTRACFEALRTLPADWTVWRAQSLQGRELRPEEPERCTVVWFDEAEQVLNAPQGEESDPLRRISAWARSRSGGPLLLLGTLRTDRHDPPGPAGSPAGGMLRQHVRMLDMPEYFDRQQAADAVLGSDPRLAEAARVAADGRVVQAVTAAPGLRARFDRAPEEVRAVLHAALDALRLGHHRSLPASLLRAAAPGYLHAAPATDTWFERAMADATAEGAGGAGLFRADHGPGFEGAAGSRAPYTLHPLLEAWYLDGRAGSVPPDAFWDALLAHADRGDLSRLARGARGIGADARAEELAAAASTYYRHRYAQFVDSGGGVELATARPYFFLSYAHTPRAGATGAGDPNLWVRQLYRDLCEAVLQLTAVPDGAPIGFMDESMHQGELWADRIARELATCRVFVPLYSPRYFDSLPCGQEWYSFTRRQVYAAHRESGHTSAIVPVLWQPTRQLPAVARELQFDHAGFGPAYMSEGLFALMKLSYYRSAYELAVHRLARRIVEVAEETVVPVGRTLDLNAQPSAFEPVRRSVRELRVLVLSCRRDELPAGPSPAAYGPQRTDWNPYGGTLGRSLAEHTAGLLRGMGFEPTVHDLVSEGERLLGEEPPTSLAVLLLDRWALLDAERIALLRRLDRRNHKVVAVLEPGGPDEPGDTAAGAELAELSRSALAAGGFLPPGRPRAGLPVLGSLSAFEDALAGVATAARRAVENRWPDAPRRGSDGEEGGSPGRPRLR
ncbi:TIR-like protein FxsC [Kitasatospora sp. A2-31]|uniref:TIR-like protein FxsC n=1 Tax=Kitasatospora sp. A2-31 TaxID=2916414 RepID=UPI001EEB3F61|nr:TIR-like protein FxsC [Kitasatospora sp. A2-31]MCG6493846.1 TIR-like protein FxsC [Kitasatospora sp. A2-31]